MTSPITKDKSRLPRKTLSSQLDRLDAILDGLAENLNDAVAQAVKDAVGLAIKEAVQGVLTEVLANPELLNKLRPEPGPRAGLPIPATPPPAVKRPGWLSRLAGTAQDACGKAANLLRQACRQVAQRACGAWESLWSCLTKAATRVKVLGRGVGAMLRGAAGVAWQLGQPLLIALGVGVALGLGGFLAGPVVSAAVNGIAGFLGSLVASTVNSQRQARTGVEHRQT
jgi:hypothetical protein